jgi:hypothetical protein
MGGLMRKIYQLILLFIFLNSASSLSFAAVSFEAVNYVVGDGPVSITTGDFNGDGMTDLAVVNVKDSNVSILLGVENGVFHEAVNYGIEYVPTSVTTADFNGDGKTDLAVRSNVDKVSILLGNGDGSFGDAVHYGAGDGPGSVTTGDLNGDGKNDLLVGGIDNISILLGNGNGTFGAAMNYSVGDGSGSVTTGDFNGDGKTDLAVANYNNDNVSVLLGIGNGTFGAAVNYSVGQCPDLVTTGDFNGDGKIDFAVANVDSSNVSILLGNGNGTFGAAVNYSAGAGSGSVTTGDFNGDGKMDLAVAISSSYNVSIRLGNGNGTFGAAVNYSAGAGPNSVITGDFNGDGKTDIAVTNYNSDNVSILVNTTLLSQYAFIVTKTGTGSGTVTSNPSGIDCGENCSKEYSQNTVVTFTATPSSGSLFTGWMGDCASCGTNSDCTVTMDTDKNCTAIFYGSPAIEYYTLSITNTGTGDGTVTSIPAGINCGTDCSETYQKTAKPKNIKLKVKPDAYSTFLGWGGDCQGRGTKTTCTVKMDSDKSVPASFGVPGISVSPDSFDFGSVVAKKTSSPMTFTIQNNGTGNLKITKINITGTDAKMFRKKGGSRKTIAPGGTYSFTVTFKPKSAGTKSATLQILSNDPDTPTIDIPLSGTGNI